KSSLKTRCYECGLILGLNDNFCPKCGRWQKSDTKAPGLTELAVTAQQLDRFFNHGLLDNETHERLKQIIKSERERLTAPSNLRPSVAPRTAAVQDQELSAWQKIEQQTVLPPSKEIKQTTVIRNEEREPVEAPHSKLPQTTVDTPTLPPAPRRTFTEVLAT